MEQNNVEHKLIPLAAESEFKENGLPFRNVNAARWAYRHRDANGLAGAFVKVGATILINVPKFHELAAKLAT
jgi:hypothetical protein